MFNVIGLDKSKLKIPIIDFASITYLPDTRSKSESNLLISFTNDFTLSIEFKEISTVFIRKNHVYYNRFLIDAKSILGVLSLDLTRELTVDCHGESREFDRTLKKFAVA